MTAPEARGSRASAALRSGLLLLVSVVVTLLVIEGGFRVYSKLSRPKMMALDETLGWTHPPSVRRRFVNEAGEEVVNAINAQGNRGPVVASVKPESVVRVLALGDSFTEGWAVDDSALVTGVLAASDPRLEVINAGVGGYGTVQQYRYMTGRGMRYEPDMVLLLVYENDFTDNLRPNLPEFGPRPYAVLEGERVRIVDTLDHEAFARFLIPLPFRQTLHRNSYAFYFVNRAWQRVQAERMREMVRAAYGHVTVDQRFRVMFFALDSLHRFLADKGVALLVVQIPTREDVAAGRAATAEQFRQRCAEAALRCLSLYEPFRRATAAGTQLYFPVDIHWTKAGHAAAAHAIGDHLRETRLVDSLWSKRRGQVTAGDHVAPGPESRRSGDTPAH